MPNSSTCNIRSRVQPWASIIGGAALAIVGISRRSATGIALASAGGFLVYSGIRSARSRLSSLHLQRSIAINRPVEDVYDFWRDFENFPRFMRHVVSVRKLDDRRSHWEVRGPLGLSLWWDAEITDERPNHFLVWRTLEGSAVEHTGSVEFRTSAHYGTEIIVALDYEAPGGELGAGLAKLFGDMPALQLEQNLRRARQLLETGEIATTEGQPSGRRGPFTRMIQAATADPKKPGRVAEGVPREIRGLA